MVYGFYDYYINIIFVGFQLQIGLVFGAFAVFSIIGIAYRLRQEEIAQQTLRNELNTSMQRIASLEANLAVQQTSASALTTTVADLTTQTSDVTTGILSNYVSLFAQVTAICAHLSPAVSSLCVIF